MKNNFLFMSTLIFTLQVGMIRLPTSFEAYLYPNRVGMVTENRVKPPYNILSGLFFLKIVIH